MIDLTDLQAEIAARQLSWTPVPKPIFSVAAGEGGQAHLGVLIDPQVASAQLMVARAADPVAFAALPAAPHKIDWRQVDGANYVTPVRDQGACGACVAFATVAVVESRLAIQQRRTDPDADLSEASLFFGAGRRCVDGWWPDAAMSYARTKGIGSEADFPYPGQDAPAKGVNPFAWVTGWESASTSSQRRKAIAFRGPVVAVFKVYEDFLQYGSGIYDRALGEYVGLHAVAVVGYDDDKQAWLIKNSWGTGWGEGGFGYVKYNSAAGIDAEYVFWDPYVISVETAAGLPGGRHLAGVPTV